MARVAGVLLVVLCILAVASGGRMGPSSRLQRVIGSSSSRRPNLAPAISLALRPLLFDYAAHIAVHVVNEKFHGLLLADVDTVANVKVLGDVRVLMTNIQLVALTADPDLANIVLGDGNLALEIEDVFFRLEADFKYQQLSFPHIAGNGHLTVTGYEGIVAAIPIFAQQNGFILVDIIDAATEFDRIDVQISGSNANWLYNLLLGMFRGNLKAGICDKITAFIKETLPQEANKILGGMPRTVDIIGAQLNTSIADNPSIQPDAAVMHVYGLFQSPSSREFEECPYSPTLNRNTSPILTRGPTKSVEKKMMKGTLHVSVLNCFAWTLHKQNRLHFHLTPQNFSAELLNTTLWAHHIPGVDEMFPSPRPMYLDLDLTLAPTGSINPEEGIIVSVNKVKSRFAAIMDEDDEVSLELFTLSIDTYLGATAQAIPTSPDEGAFLRLRDPDQLDVLFKVIFSRITDTITDYLDTNPITIPSIPLIMLSNAVISFENDVGILDSDLLYVG
ncbi:hypothetical protein SeLEV6574_g04540 [Synchytrium endobioticum]|uniref:Lipid-binding serum glycoprotein C-terminal domain-containing protein n=1 Tax=Synchytrium endobioticum TaxID=286115 RepID=A0A507CYX7_9FUNG|nr:hypothetical protein SeLEV6574_g04540 [Synchytrium endobioticum]